MGGGSHRLAGGFLLCPVIPPTTMEWSKLSDKKNSFIIRDVILSNTISAAFSQARLYRVYKEKPKELSQSQWDDRKEKIREDIGKLLTEIGNGYDPINDHSERIQSFKEKAEIANSDVLEKGYISFGVAQKLINMHLKYL